MKTEQKGAKGMQANKCLDVMKTQGTNEEDWGLHFGFEVNCYCLQDPRAQLTMRNKLVDFLVDTGTTYLVLNIKLTKKSSATVSIARVTNQPQQKAFLQPLKCKMEDLKMSHSFLYVPVC